MARLRWRRIALLVLCAGLSALWGQRTRPEIRGGISMVDFGEIYYGARCARHHQDAYDPHVVLREFKAEGGSFPTHGVPAKVAPIIVSINVNLPTALFLIAPLAMLPWAVAQTLWTILTIVLLVLAGYLMWSLSDNTAPALSGFFVCLALANCEQLLAVGNVAGIVVSLCVVACWCLLQQRCSACGVVLLAISYLGP